jgi:hypothetical protein
MNCTNVFRTSGAHRALTLGNVTNTMCENSLFEKTPSQRRPNATAQLARAIAAVVYCLSE